VNPYNLEKNQGLWSVGRGRSDKEPVGAPRVCACREVFFCLQIF
jgi:hypothetical protein